MDGGCSALFDLVIGGDSKMNPERKVLYNSKAWQRCRIAYAKSKGGLCERCLAKGIYKPGEIVHHKIHLTEENYSDPSVALNFDNLQLLCRDCHAQMHNSKRYRVDELGRVIFL